MSNMDNRYKIIKEFDINGKHMTLIKIGDNVHTMDNEDLMKLYGSRKPKYVRRGA